MTAVHTTAARWRGAAVGVCAAALTIGAHGFGGGMFPSGAALVMLVLVSALLGFASGLPAARRGIAMIALFLIGGQAAGHLILTCAAGHSHGLGVSPTMLAAHLVAALACAGLICAAERLGAAAATRLRHLIRIVVPIEAPGAVICTGRGPQPVAVRRPVYLRYRGNRAPPACCA